MVRYKMLKQRIKACTAERQTIFDTGGFKKILREDMIRINAHWRDREEALTAQSAAAKSLSYLWEQHRAEVQRVHRWLTLNYLAVLKITKKHDKRCGSCLAEPVSKVLMSQPFVIGLLNSSHFIGEPGTACAPPPLPGNVDSDDDASESATAESDDGESSSRALHATKVQIRQLIGESSLIKYMPSSILSRISEGTLQTDLDPTLDTQGMPGIDDDSPKDSPAAGRMRRQPSFEHGLVLSRFAKEPLLEWVPAILGSCVFVGLALILATQSDPSAGAEATGNTWTRGSRW